MREILDADQRLVLLRSLAECGGEANESVLQTCLDTYGHRLSRDRVRSHLGWLEEQGLCSVNDVAGCLVATLTGRGVDVAEGRSTVPGVKRPRPRG
ncbi:ArsR family transcriptional regulator [Xenorhabdus sp. XENO-7]|uniref:ArsR family transcriptional regulator n=1 Tax=Xenorhabdus aichiensis TaxID=3025874 RepID=A0ABT5M1F6_9GAMM|nr:ArsR family transcriptional regulator [Xenorhabdus aichiensis]MDC9620126.1 ArsR family transcriptional regulator [Xenorhabdus aichiensis]